MKTISAFLSAVAVVGVLTACSGGMGPPATVLSSLPESMAGQIPSAAPEVPRLREENLLGPEQVREGERMAAMALYEQFQGTYVSDLDLGEVVMAGRLSCAMSDPANRDFYDPAALKESMRITYIWHREQSEIRFLPAMVEQFCPEFHPGDEVIDQLIIDITSVNPRDGFSRSVG